MNNEITNETTNTNAVETTVSALDKLTSWQREKFLAGCEKTLKKFVNASKLARRKFNGKMWLKFNGDRHSYLSDGRSLLSKRLPDGEPDGDWQCYGDRVVGGYEPNNIKPQGVITSCEQSESYVEKTLNFAQFDGVHMHLESELAELRLAGYNDENVALKIGEYGCEFDPYYLVNLFRWISELAGGKNGYGKVQFSYAKSTDSQTGEQLKEAVFRIKLFQDQIKDGEEVKDVYMGVALLMPRRTSDKPRLTIHLGEFIDFKTVQIDNLDVKEAEERFYIEFCHAAKTGFEEKPIGCFGSMECNLMKMKWSSSYDEETFNRCVQVLRDKDLDAAIKRREEIKAAKKAASENASDDENNA